MPCNSEYMLASDYEKQISRVACLLDELSGEPIKGTWWSGYHPRVYGKVSRTLGDQLTQELCTSLQSLDVSKYSLEMQIWWRDHQAADKARLERELSRAQLLAEKGAALSKLTLYERKLLGF